MSTPKRGPGRPPIPEEQRPVRVPLNLPPDLLALVERRCKQEGVTRTEWIRRALVAELSR